MQQPRPLPKRQPKPRQRKPLKRKQVLFTGVGVTAATLGFTASVATFSGQWIGQWLSPPPANVNLGSSQGSSVLALASRPANERAKVLTEQAKGSASLDRNRARYLLASDLIQQDHGGQALPLLQGLEKDYPTLAAPILAKRAQAYAATGDRAKAEATWNELLKQYPNDAAAAEALFNLGQRQPQFWDQAIARFPAHPRTVEIALNRLEKNPNQPQLLLLVARYGHYVPNVEAVLNRLKTEYASQLTAADWEAIGFNFWENGLYGNAGAAYAKASPTALNLYRTARGAELGERYNDAVAGYQRLIQAFPEAEETGMALLKLANLAEKPEDAIAYLDQAIARFPAEAAEALLLKANTLQGLNSTESAMQARQSVLSQYSHSETAAEIRWEQAEQNALKGDLKAAWEWARQLVQENPDSTHAPEAAFWVGKWALQLGQKQDSQKSFEYVLARYPESYYAWRSASLLGWDVGDFTTVRQKLPSVKPPAGRAEPLAGSETAKELYRLGQDREAWSYWQVEFTNRVKPTVAEQFTDGLMRLGVSDNLDGIFMLSSLAWREPAAEQAEYQRLRQQPGYWQALYPFPFVQPIEQWSQKRQLNPMLVTALIRQESRFEPKIESVAGALGLMQVMPDTADWIAKQDNLKTYNLQDPNDNIKLGTWYLDYTHQEYANNSLFAVASYNAGPGSVAEWIQEFSFSDPDRFVEQIPYAETQGYVKSVFENYWNYLRLYNPEVSQKLAQYSQEHSALVKAPQP